VLQLDLHRAVRRDISERDDDADELAGLPGQRRELDVERA
jgi:hypothetical protein